MGLFEGIKKFISSSYALEKAALEIYERLPISLRNRILLGSSFLRWVAFLKESEHWDRGKLQAYQLEQLKDLLKHCMKNVPYYRRIFLDYGFTPEKIQSLEDIKVLPYLSKETVRDSLYDFLDKSLPRKFLLKDYTSGSTGIRLTVYRTTEASAIYQAFIVNSLNRVNYSPKAREVQFWNMIRLGKGQNLPFIKYSNKLIFSNQYRSNEWLFKYAEMMGKLNPEFIVGFPSSLSLFSSFIRENNLILPENLKAVISYGETLYDWQKVLIEEVFRTRVFSLYSMTELNVFGCDCEYNASLHIYPQYGFTEFVVLSGGCKEIVTTGFTNYAMPFVRYKTSDVVEKVEEYCSQCGRHHQLADKIEGRMNDFLIDKKGKVIPRLFPVIETFSNIKQWQFYQEDPGKAHLRIVKAETYSETDTRLIKVKIQEILGPIKDTMDIDIIFVNTISRTSSGKITLVDQRLDIRKFL